MTQLSDAILSLLRMRGWYLADPSESPTDWDIVVSAVRENLVEGTENHITEDQKLERAVIRAYCPVFYAACRADGTPRQHEAFQELWRWVYPRAFRRVNSGQDAEDVAQGVLIKVYKSLDAVKEPRGFLAWVNVITINEVRSYYRRLRKELPTKERTGSDEDDFDSDVDLLSTDDLAAQLELELDDAEAELAARIFDCMESRRRKQAEVLIMLGVLGQSVLKVAETLQISPDSVYVLFHRAKKSFVKNCVGLLQELLQHRMSPRQPSERRG